MPEIVLEIWFSRRKGPYHIIGGYKSLDWAEHFWADDPDYIGANKLDAPEDRPPVVQEYLAREEKRTA